MVYENIYRTPLKRGHEKGGNVVTQVQLYYALRRICNEVRKAKKAE